MAATPRSCWIRRWGSRFTTALPAGTGYTTLEFKISFIKGMTSDTGPVRTEGRTLNVGRRAATAEARITDAKGRLLAHATTTCLVFEIPKGHAERQLDVDRSGELDAERERLTSV